MAAAYTCQKFKIFFAHLTKLSTQLAKSNQSWIALNRENGVKSNIWTENRL